MINDVMAATTAPGVRIMYAVLGEIEFDVVAYWDEFESTMGVDYQPCPY